MCYARGFGGANERGENDETSEPDGRGAGGEKWKGARMTNDERSAYRMIGGAIRGGWGVEDWGLGFGFLRVGWRVGGEFWRGVAGEADFLFPEGEALLGQEDGAQRGLALKADDDDTALPSEEEGAANALPGPLVDHVRTEEAEDGHGGVTDQ